MFGNLFGPKTLAAYQAKALAAHRRGDAAQALRLTEEALARFPEEDDAWSSRIASLLAHGRSEEARATARRLIAARPERAVGWFQLGRLEHDLEQLTCAEQAYARAVEIEPNYLPGWVNLGCVQDDQGNHEGALTAYERALALDPNDAMAWRNRANSLCSLGDYAASEQAYERAIALGEEVAVGLRRALAFAGKVETCNQVPARLGDGEELGELREQRVSVNDVVVVARYFLGDFSHPELLDAVVEYLVEFAVSRVREHGLADGHTLSLPWSRVSVRQRGNELVLHEPDWDSPGAALLLPHVTGTAQSMVMCKLVHELVGVDPVATDYRHTIHMDPDALSAETVILYRKAPGAAGESGWSAFSKPNSPNSKAFPLCVLAARRPHLTKVLTLPIGFRAHMIGDSLVRVLDGEGKVRFSADP